ncbi:MAG: DUF2283 domain-containing protein [Gaiellaceae bacterium]
MDGRKDAAYIYFRDFDDGEAARQHHVSAPDIGGIFVLDFDRKGRLLGVEVQMASKGLPPEVLAEAQRV